MNSYVVHFSNLGPSTSTICGAKSCNNIMSQASIVHNLDNPFFSWDEYKYFFLATWLVLQSKVKKIKSSFCLYYVAALYEWQSLSLRLSMRLSNTAKKCRCLGGYHCVQFDRT